MREDPRTPTNLEAASKGISRTAGQFESLEFVLPSPKPIQSFVMFAIRSLGSSATKPSVCRGPTITLLLLVFFIKSVVEASGEMQISSGLLCTLANKIALIVNVRNIV
ncbi:hypothetical protein [Ranid herpesvirus 3]|uniref:Uncharacterized protein n=1 Tax=Ranid herpesvirus 3 TaxID=1987509 RepID=A0A1X9T5H7_9VIRU|nr:hypothetical protein [Ranid herpesvirus 3]ARR28947.1 hypothetical protein [Ranid herpesvirus 3]